MKDIEDSFLDSKELELLNILTLEYKEFIEPNFLQKGLNSIQEKISDFTPESVKQVVHFPIKKASEWDIIQTAITKASKGFGIVQENTAKFTLDKDRIINVLKESNQSLQSFEGICAIRSYEIEKVVVVRRKNRDLPSAFLGGGFTGFFGLPALPVNIAFTFLMYFRTVQSIGLYYGYDVVNDSRELEFASSVTLTCLSPNMQNDVENLTSMIGKMMLAANVTALTEALAKYNYTEMAKKGGIELLYVQLRALANKQAQKALEKAGEKGIEAGIFKKLLEQLGQHLSKEVGKKAVPVVGALIGALSDTYTIHQVIKGANLIYHKRFLFEKARRIQDLNTGKRAILNYEDIIKKGY